MEIVRGITLPATEDRRRAKFGPGQEEELEEAATKDELVHLEEVGAIRRGGSGAGGVSFTSESARQRAEELGVSESDLEPGGGGGKDGAYRVSDVEEAAEAKGE